MLQRNSSRDGAETERPSAEGSFFSKSVSARILAPGESRTDYAKGLVDTVVSTGEVDRDSEIILPSSLLADLPVYKNNPILCWGHPLSTWATPPPERLIGKGVDIEIQRETDDHPGFVRVLWEYAFRQNPMAKMALDLIEGDYLKAYSIGAMMRDGVWFDDNQERKEALPRYAQEALTVGRAILVHTRMEWLETSNVYAGSNRSALRKAVEDGVVTREFAMKAMGFSVHQRAIHPVAIPEKKVEVAEMDKKEIETLVRSVVAEELAKQPKIEKAAEVVAELQEGPDIEAIVKAAVAPLMEAIAKLAPAPAEKDTETPATTSARDEALAKLATLSDDQLNTMLAKMTADERKALVALLN